MAFCLGAVDGQTLNAGLAALGFFGILSINFKKPYIFVIFQWGGGTGVLVGEGGGPRMQQTTIFFSFS